MERYFDQRGPAGRTMMCNTASIQVNVGLGGADGPRRWRAGPPARAHPHRRLRQLPLRRRPPHGLAVDPAAGLVAARPHPFGTGRCRAPGGRRVHPLRARCPGHADQHDRVDLRAGHRAVDLRRLDGVGPRAGLAHARRPPLPPHHPVPAGPAQGLARAAHVRCPSDARLAGRPGGDRGPAHRSGRRRRGFHPAPRAPSTSGSTRPSSGWAIHGWHAAPRGSSRWPSRRSTAPARPSCATEAAAYHERWVARGRSARPTTGSTPGASPASSSRPPSSRAVGAGPWPIGAPRERARATGAGRRPGRAGRRAGRGRGRARSDLLDGLTEAEQRAQVSPLMSPFVWDLAHIGNYEELWLLRALDGRGPIDPALDDLYNAFEHPRWERPSLPILGPGAGPGLPRAGARRGARPARARRPRPRPTTRCWPTASSTAW